MIFRPHLVTTFITLLTLVALLVLGWWQLQRADWKSDLIAEFDERAAAEPVTWREGVCPYLSGESVVSSPPMRSDTVEQVLASETETEPVLRVFGRSVGGQVGWRLFRPVSLDACGPGSGSVLVQEGFEAEQVGPLPPAVETAEVRFNVAPWPARGWMAGSNDPEANQWYWLDHVRIAAMNAGDLNGAIIVTPFAGKPDHLVRTPPVRHISYAVTWFGLALCLVIVYGVAHAKAGRLSFHGQGKSPKA